MVEREREVREGWWREREVREGGHGAESMEGLKSVPNTDLKILRGPSVLHVS